MNDTLLNTPNLPSFGTGLDRTVKFNSSKNEFLDESINSAKVNGEGHLFKKHASPYQRWA